MRSVQDAVEHVALRHGEELRVCGKRLVRIHRRAGTAVLADRQNVQLTPIAQAKLAQRLADPFLFRLHAEHAKLRAEIEEFKEVGGHQPSRGQLCALLFGVDDLVRADAPQNLSS